MSCCGNPATSLPRGTAANPFIVKQGSTFEFTLRFYRNGTSRDLSDRTGQAQLRQNSSLLGTPIASFDVTIREPQTGSDRGKVDVRLGATVTAYPQMQPGDYLFDVELVADDDPDDVIGTDIFYLRLMPEVTTV
jgi:hypothetical protein